ncbi:MAG: NAD(P)-dependent oxidoreductase [Sandaracinaceae bacterium]|nr:NAD(P)-dependent oxidoreductase [Sandaracinaceae bacterium]
MGRILVTGSEGFVGRHLVAAIEARGLEAVGVDLPRTGASIEVDLGSEKLDPAALVKRAGDVQAVIYMAAKITRGSSVDADARRNLRAIAEAPVRIMEAFVERGGRPPHLVACSTFKMYGPPRDDGPVDPADPPQSPDPHSYGSAKFLAERLLEIGSARSGFSFAVVRPSCIYGPGQHGHNAIPRFLRAALAGERPVVFGDGTSLRDDVFAPDLASLMLEAALQGAHGAFHACGESSRTIADVARVCCEAVEVEGGPKLSAQLDPSREPKWWIDQRFDREPSEQVLSYVPTDLLEGLRRQVRWMKAGEDPKDTARFGRPE